MRRAAASPSGADIFVLANLQPSRAEKVLAFAVVLALFGAFLLATRALASTQRLQIPAFIPAYTTAIFLTQTITAVLLFTQFSVVRTHGLLVLSSGYLFTGFMAVPWMLTFPGVFTPGTLMGGLQSPAYIYGLWHAGFPVFVICYALLKDAGPGKGLWRGSVASGISLSIVVSGAMVLVSASLFILKDAMLPPMQITARNVGPFFLHFVAAPTGALVIAALVVLWIRRRSVLDLWLMVVMCSSGIESCLIFFTLPGRYGAGWYAGRMFGLWSSSLVLLVLLYEITSVHTRLLRAARAEHHEREARLITGEVVAATIAHELKQPLTAMVLSADAGLCFLDRPSPDVDQAKYAFDQVLADGHRAGAVLTSVRASFKKEESNKALLDLNELIRETVNLLREELRKYEIRLELDLSEYPPTLLGNRIQLQQVLINLITNSIESMVILEQPGILRIGSRKLCEEHVEVSIADTGTGIGDEHVEKLFNPLYTTKSEGLGMGLSICRSIIESHNGRLWVELNRPRGAVFHFTSSSLPREGSLQPIAEWG